MKKVIPFKKQIYFNSNVEEITSISLEHTLTVVDKNLISGYFIINGEYRMTASSISIDPFEFKVPCDIEINDRYKLDKVQINIDDFYYEIIDSKALEVNIDVLIDKLEEEDIVDEIPIKYVTMEQLEEDLRDDNNSIDLNDEVIPKEEIITKNKIEEEEDERVVKEEKIFDEGRCIENENNTKSIFNNFNDSLEEYRTYRVYIVREGDTLEQILTKYQIDKEELEKYNDLKELTLGDKIIVPYSYENNK